MKITPSYWYAVQWIALNDEPLDKNLDDIKGYISTCLIADLFGVTTEKIARHILDYRRGSITITAARALDKAERSRRINRIVIKLRNQ